jgi:predicted DNA-binding transcriptional regulator AlpA
VSKVALDTETSAPPVPIVEILGNKNEPSRAHFGSRRRAASHSARVTMTARALSEMRPVPRRGLSRDESAMYIGISATKFDDLVADGRMPAPVKIDGRKVWDVRALDLAFDALVSESSSTNSWDGVAS